MGGRRRRKCWAGTGRDISVCCALHWEWGTFPSRAAPDPFEASQRPRSCPTLLSAGGETAERKLGDTAALGMAGEGMRCWRVRAGVEASCGGAGCEAMRAWSGQATGRLRPGEEEEVAFFFSLKSF